MALRPLRDYLVVKELLPQVGGNLILLQRPTDPGFVKEAVVGEVLALGPGTKTGNDMWGLKIGDRIAYSPVGAVPTPDGTLLRLGSVMGVIQA